MEAIVEKSVTSKVEFECRTMAGYVLRKFDDVGPAKEHILNKRKIGINLKLVQVTKIEEEINV